MESIKGGEIQFSKASFVILSNTMLYRKEEKKLYHSQKLLFNWTYTEETSNSIKIEPQTWFESDSIKIPI